MTHLNERLLVTLLDLAQSDVPANVQTLAQQLGESRRDVACALDDLDRAGLVRGQTVRLTLVGLMHASGLRSRSRTIAAA